MVRKSLSYNEVSVTLVNHELRKKDKQSSISTSTEVLATKGIGSNHWKVKCDIDK